MNRLVDLEASSVPSITAVTCPDSALEEPAFNSTKLVFSPSPITAQPSTRQEEDDIPLPSVHRQDSMSPPRVQVGDWESGLFSCLSDPAICLCGYFCGSCLFCQNASSLGKSGKTWWLMSYCFPMLSPLRSLTRERYSLAGSYEEDLVFAMCCGPCVNCQVARQLKRGKGGGYVST